MKFIRPKSPETMIPAGPIGLEEGRVEASEVSLSLQKIDAAWKEDIFSYSGVGGADRKEHKVSGVKRWINENGFVYSPIIYIANGEPENLSFVDGRHTTAALVELGLNEAVFIVPAIQRQAILETFGVA